MKTIYTYGEKRETRNLTVADIRACKGIRKLTQTNPTTANEAAAAVEAGIDTLICGQSQYDEVRLGAPHTFLTAALMLTDFPTDLDTIRAAMKYMEEGADAIYTPRRLEVIKMLTDEGIPVMGHLGLVPRKCTWVGGLRPVGGTVGEARMLLDQFTRLEDAGAFAVEAEVIPEQILAEISQRTSLMTFSLGSGALGDVIYMFASDILGESESPPRHAKAYADLRRLREEMQSERVHAFRQFVDETHSGKYPSSDHSVRISVTELEGFRECLS